MTINSAKLILTCNIKLYFYCEYDNHTALKRENLKCNICTWRENEVNIIYPILETKSTWYSRVCKLNGARCVWRLSKKPRVTRQIIN